jgi:signal transduction histidine kinase
LPDDVFYTTCDTINTNAQYLSKTIDDFRNFISGNRTKLQFNLASNINSLLHLIEGTIKIHNISIVLELEDDIRIRGYQNELTQCLINIFNNSKDALIASKIENRLIFITTKKIKDNAVIEIKDNAGGISSEILPRVFEPYFTTKHQSQGTGLGLHMTYKLIVEGMKGTIESTNINYEYNNTYYRGALFTIIIPMR